MKLWDARAGGIAVSAAVYNDDDVMQRPKLSDRRARLVIAVVTIDIEAVRQRRRLAVLHQNGAEFKRLPGVRLLKLVGDKSLLARSVRLGGKAAVFIDDEQMVLGDVLTAQHLAVADDDAVSMIAAEVRVNCQNGIVAAGNIADRFIDAALEIVARKRRSELIDAGQLNIADEIGHAVLLLLLDGNSHAVVFVVELTRFVMFETGRCICLSDVLRNICFRLSLRDDGFLFGFLLDRLLFRFGVKARGGS